LTVSPPAAVLPPVDNQTWRAGHENGLFRLIARVRGEKRRLPGAVGPCRPQAGIWGFLAPLGLPPSCPHRGSGAFSMPATAGARSRSGLSVSRESKWFYTNVFFRGRSRSDCGLPTRPNQFPRFGPRCMPLPPCSGFPRWAFRMREVHDDVLPHRRRPSMLWDLRIFQSREKPHQRKIGILPHRSPHSAGSCIRGMGPSRL